jgi:cytochrome c peroxidase
MGDVFTVRMSGPALSQDEIDDVGRWLDAEPSVRSAAPSAASIRGEALFHALDCARCHSGPRFTDNLNHDVGTGGFFQTPSLLGVSTRPPYLHHGLAETLADRFDRFHTQQHGARPANDRDTRDLIAYLETL